LRLRLVGVPTLTAAGQPAGVALERKTAAALWWLVSQGPVRRERLAQLLWPPGSGVDAEAARANLRQVSFRIKRIAGLALVDGREELALTVPLALDPGAPGAVLLEGCEFPDCPELAARLDEARLQHAQQDLDARLAAAQRAELCGDLGLAEQLARQLLQDDPLHEGAHRQLIRALYLRGDRAAALAAGHQCMQALQAGLGVAPDAHTRSLLEDVRRGERWAVAPLADTAMAQPLPVTVLRPPRMVGRGGERLALLQALQAQQPGGLVLLQGEAGLGKSRLLQDVFDGPGAPVALLVQARPGDAAVVLSTLARGLRALLAWRPRALVDAFAGRVPASLGVLLPEFGDGSCGPDTAPALADALHTAVARLLACSGPPAIWVVDDLHHADDASVDMLRQIQADAGTAGWSWLVSCRPAEGGATARTWLRQQAAEGRLTTVALAPLGAGAITELLETLHLPGVEPARWTPLLLQRTGGNPLFLLEMLKVALGSGGGTADADTLPTPQAVASLIGHRLQQLSPAARALARVAALAGPDFDAALAAHVLQQPALALADAWRELEDAQVLRDQAFAHDLILEATLADVPVAIQRHTRRAMAQHLEQCQAEPARVAAHWLAADEPALAAPHLEAAARLAEARVCYTEAKALLEQAAAAHDASGHRDAGGAVRLRLAGLLGETNQRTEAMALLEHLARAGLHASLHVRVTVERIHQLSHDGRTHAALDLGQQALSDERLLEEAGDQQIGALRQAVADMLLELGRGQEALQLLQAVGDHLDDPEQPERRAWFRSSLGRAWQVCGNVAAAEECYELALASARRWGRQRQISGVLLYLAAARSLAGRLLSPLETLEEALQLVAEGGPGSYLAQVLQVQAARAGLPLGRYRQALSALDPVPESLAPGWRFNAACVLAQAWAALGQHQRAAQAWQLARDIGGASTVFLGRLTACELAWLAGDGLPAPSAVDTIDCQHLSTTEALQLGLLEARFGPGGADARASLARHRDQAQAGGLHGMRVLADVLLCRIAAQDGDKALAVQLGTDALAALRHCTPFNTYRGGLWHALWAALRDTDPATAALAARTGAEWVRNVAHLHVPSAYRHSFLHGNRFNADLLAADA